MLKIVFFGTPSFSATILRELVKNAFRPLAVVTKPDKPRGRSSQLVAPEVKIEAQAHSIPVFQPQKASAQDFVDQLKNFDADLFIVVAYSEILKENVLKTPRLGCINVHASLLPKYRGAAPIQRAIMEGEKETGVTIMSMAKELDAGEILHVSKMLIPPDMTAGELFEALAPLGAKALIEALQKIDEEKRVRGFPQDPTQVTYAKKLNLEDGLLLWDKQIVPLYNQFRGVTPRPGAWSWIFLRGEQKRLLIKKARPIYEASLKPAQWVFEKGQMAVGCFNGALQLLEVQLEGKKNLTAAQFLNGIAKEELKF